MQVGDYQETIFPGDSSEPWTLQRLNSAGVAYDLSAYDCQLTVDDAGIDRAVNTMSVDNKSFITGLTPAETAGLAIGVSYRARLTLSNLALVPAYKRTYVIWVHITDQKGC